MNQNEIVKTVAIKYGTIEAGRYYLREAKKNLSTIKVGIADNNPLLIAKDVELLATNLDALAFMFGDEQSKKEIQNLKKVLGK